MSALWGIDNPNIKILDCSVRDGGLVNDHRFDLEFVQAVYRACAAAGVDYMEVGYKNSDRIFPRDANGAWKYCDEDDLRAVVGENPETGLKLSCMIDAEKSDWRTAVLPKEKSPLDLIRVAFYDYQVDEAVAMIDDAAQKGYEVCANLMAVTAVDESVIDRVLERLVETPTGTIVIVDSFGSLTPAQTEYLTQKYFRFANAAGKEVGMHAHNNMQLAFSNTLTSARCGATRLDASIGGLGRGAGNCPMELLLSVVNAKNYKLRPIIECLENALVPLRREIEWGPLPEYMLTGQFNQHPRAAIAARKEPETRDRFLALFDRLREKCEESK